MVNRAWSPMSLNIDFSLLAWRCGCGLEELGNIACFRCMAVPA